MNTKKHFEFEIKPQMSYIAVECSGLECVVVRVSLREQICNREAGVERRYGRVERRQCIVSAY